VRVDLWYMTLSRRGQIWVDITGTVLFLIPACLLLAWLSWPFFLQSFPNEVSTNRPVAEVGGFGRGIGLNRGDSPVTGR